MLIEPNWLQLLCSTINYAINQSNGYVSLLQEAAHLGILYFGEPDQTGHDYGPFSEEVQNMILELDATLGYLVQRLTETKVM